MVYRGRGKGRELVTLMKRSRSDEEKPRKALRLLIDDVEVKIGVKKSASSDSNLLRIGGGRCAAKKRVVKGAWSTCLKESAAKKHGSKDDWTSKEVKSYDEVLCDVKKTLEEELAALKAKTTKCKREEMEARRAERKAEIEAQNARVDEAEKGGEWGDIALEMEALSALEAEISAVWD